MKKILRQVGDDISGHEVQGHVDCTTTILAKYKKDDDLWLTFAMPPQLRSMIVKKGT